MRQQSKCGVHERSPGWAWWVLWILAHKCGRATLHQRWWGGPLPAKDDMHPARAGRAEGRRVARQGRPERMNVVDSLGRGGTSSAQTGHDSFVARSSSSVVTEREGVPMSIVGGLDIHRKQLTFDYLDTDTGELRRGQLAPAPDGGTWSRNCAAPARSRSRPTPHLGLWMAGVAPAVVTGLRPRPDPHPLRPGRGDHQLSQPLGTPRTAARSAAGDAAARASHRPHPGSLRWNLNISRRRYAPAG
jgi:hypothetical protein